GGLRGFFEQQNQIPVKLKAMVPVSVRHEGNAGDLGNQISFIYVDLPCDEPDPVRRLRGLALAMGTRKRGGEPEGADNMLSALSYAPRPVQHAITRSVASPRAFNLVVSNIPGPQQPLYMLGCELAEVFPIVPLSDQHAVSIGMTTINDRAFFGIYADTQSLPNADLLSAAIDESVEELSASGSDALLLRATCESEFPVRRDLSLSSGAAAGPGVVETAALLRKARVVFAARGNAGEASPSQLSLVHASGSTRRNLVEESRRAR
ncbi:MAG: WSD1 family O-acyltransferase, partial [Chloroflexota bacterium]|nr:WSD1 family O-acyltransferase [Chloroflexota bacterium]